MIVKKYSYLLVFLLLAVFVVQTTYSVRDKSPTYDEPNWVNIAWYLTHTWSWQADYHVLMHPPLSFYLHGIPLRLWELWHKNSLTKPPEEERAERFPYPYSAFFRYDTVFTIAKFSMLPVAILLGWYVYLWASRLYGVYAGIFALSMHVFNPYILAYATIITSDMTATCFMFIATYYFWRFCRCPSKCHIVFAGMTFGFALLSKASAVLLFPVFGIFCLSAFSYRKRVLPQNTSFPPPSLATHKPGILLIGMGLISCIALGVLEAGYLFDIQPIRAFHANQTTDLLYRVFKDIPIPFGAYINGVRLHQGIQASVTHKFFLAGKDSTSTWWYYHILVFLFKNPISFTIFLVLSILSWEGARKKFIFRENFLIVPALFLLLYFSFFVSLNTTSRYLLPAYPFLFVFISRIMTFEVLKKTSARIVCGVLILWYILSSLVTFPNYLAYCNELIGGTENGYKWFADSSFDWGQDLKGLGHYVQAQQIPLVKLAYFGKAVPEYYGIRYIPLLEPEGCHPTNGVIAISTTKLQGVYEQNQHCYSWLKQYEPIDKIGYTIFIYSIK